MSAHKGPPCPVASAACDCGLISQPIAQIVELVICSNTVTNGCVVCTGNFCRTLQELQKEAQMCILHHTNIVELFAIIAEPGHYGIVMEYVLHGELYQYIHDNNVRCSVSGSYKCVQLLSSGMWCPCFCGTPTPTRALKTWTPTPTPGLIV